MASRHLLLVTYHFPPSAASGTFRMLGFARHLPKFGWRISVVAPPELPWEPVDAALTNQIPPETTVHAVPYPRGALKAVRWFAPWGVWLRPAWKTCRNLLKTEHVDVVLTSGPPQGVHVLGHFLKRRFGVPWIADFRDPWVSGRAGPPPRGIGGWWMRHWERKVFRNADLILGNADNATRAQQDACPQWADKMATLTNGFDPLPDLPHVPGERDHIRLVHTGELYAGRDPRPLFDAVAGWNRALSPGKKPIHLDMVGRTTQCGLELQTEIETRGLADRIKLFGQVPYQQATQALTTADVLVLFDGPGRKIGVPAKVYEYLGAGRPILALAEEDGDTAHILRQSGVLHRIVSPSKLESLPQALAEMAELAPNAEEAPGRARFTRESLAGRLAQMMDQCLGRTNHPSQPLAV